MGINPLLASFGLILFLHWSVYSQTPAMTLVRGRVLDANTEEPLPFATVRIPEANMGTRTDAEGRFLLRTAAAGPLTLRITYMGYAQQELPLRVGEEQELSILLREAAAALQEVTVRVEHYRNKDNPAVALIRKAIEHKAKNRPEALPYYQYEKYEKIGFALNNITEKTRNNPLLRRFRVIFDNADTNRVNNKVNALIYMRELLADVYYRGATSTRREYVRAERHVIFEDAFHLMGISNFIDALYTDVNFYDGAIELLNTRFVGPLNPLSPNIYRFYIQDTTLIEQTPCVRVYFAPRVKTDVAFTGNLWIALDSTYALRRVEVGVPSEINLNWVNELQLTQEYSWIVAPDGSRALMLSRDDVSIEFGLLNSPKARSLLGSKMTSFRHYRLNEPIADSLFAPLQAVVRDTAASLRDEQFWAENRHLALSRGEAGLKQTMDSLNRDRGFKRLVKSVRFLFEGYTPIGGIDIGPANVFYSFNPIEGLRLRFGGRTNYDFSTRLALEGYGAYGFGDQRWKGMAALTYSFGPEKVRLFPIHHVRLWYQDDIEIPGQGLQFVNEDNLFLSLKRGPNNRMIYKNTYGIEYRREFLSGFSWRLTLRNMRQNPAGILLFDYTDQGETRYKTDLMASEVAVRLRYAPNEKFYDGPNYRTPILTKYPIWELAYQAGIRGVLGSEYNYHIVRGTVRKAFFYPILGQGYAIAEGGWTFGQAPYPMLILHRANQTYTYQREAYNLMNFLEFISDRYAALSYYHNFGGYFFGRIPLLRRLRWREVFTIKALWGGLSEQNRPNESNHLLHLPTYEDGSPMSYSLDDKPYVEGSIGIANIFGILRFDLLRRFTYTDHPFVTRWGVRVRLSTEF